MSEPLVHSEIEDSLPENHPLAYKDVDCVVCQNMLHANNNECMCTWVETGLGPHCLPCYVAEDIQSKGSQKFWMPGSDECRQAYAVYLRDCAEKRIKDSTNAPPYS